MLHNQNFSSRNIKCNKCGSYNLIELFNGQVVCADCGFVITQSASSYDKNDHIKRNAKRSRISLELEEHKLKSETWSRAPFPLNIKFEELLKELRIYDSLEKNMVLALYEITRIVLNLSLTEEVLIEATRIYEKLAKKCNFKGKSMKAMCSAIVYVASKRAGVPCGLREVAYVARVSSNKVFKCCEFILTQLNSAASMWSVNPYIRRVCQLLGVKNQTVEIIEKIMLIMHRGGHRNGKSLPGLVSASIYIASTLIGECKTQREIVEVTRVTEATLRARYKDIVKNLLFTVII